MSLWNWTLRAYAQPGVPEATLDLQDRYGQNTSLLLWAVWAEASDPGLLGRAAEVAEAWERTALVPLRDVRRALKVPLPPVDDGSRLALREDVKAAELRAERLLMETLEAMTGDPGGAPALEALRAASAAWSRTAPDDALAVLASALG